MRDFTNQYTLEVRIASKPVQEYNNLNGNTYAASRSRPVQEYIHTDGNVYIEGRAGSKYSLYFHNHSAERVCVIPAVDGLSVFDGQEAGLKSKGYIVDAYGHIEIPGWTLSNSEVAAFEFADLRNSYSAQSGKGTTNTGVIGVLVFRERVYPRITASSFPTLSATRGMVPAGGGWYGSGTDFGSMSTSNVQGTNAIDDAVGLGTGFGEKESFKTHEVTFEKRDPNHPDAMMAIYYDSEKGLAKRGIIVKTYDNKPNPFPSYAAPTIGCKPPPGWKG